MLTVLAQSHAVGWVAVEDRGWHARSSEYGEVVERVGVTTLAPSTDQGHKIWG